MGNCCAHNSEVDIEAHKDGEARNEPEMIRGVPSIDHRQLKGIKASESTTIGMGIVEYENLKHEEPLEMVPEIQAGLGSDGQEFLTSRGGFKFRLSEYPGKSNPVRLIREHSGGIYYGNCREANGETIKEGRGYYIDEKGYFYMGYFANSVLEGPAVMLVKKSTLFKGIWSDNSMNGFGYSFSNKSNYSGNWVNSLSDGYGEEKWTDAEYRGQFKAGYKHGNGEFFWFNDGSHYKGEFEKGKPHGKGEHTWKEGKKYIGDWREEKMEGHGRFEWPDGRYYDGAYIDDRKEGFGVFAWPDGRRFEGMWHNGKQHGPGKFIDKSGAETVGEWVNGTKLPNHQFQN